MAPTKNPFATGNRINLFTLVNQRNVSWLTSNTNLPANWGCRFVYLIHGVCRQEANRGLYTSGKTVYKAAGYWAFKAAFGTYGSGGTWSAYKTACWLWW